jgi:hypothetical protein
MLKPKTNTVETLKAQKIRMAIIYRLGETGEFIESATGQCEKMENENYHKRRAVPQIVKHHQQNITLYGVDELREE